MLGTNVRDRVNMNDIDKTIGGHTMEKFYPEVADHNKAQETLKKVMNFGKSFME